LGQIGLRLRLAVLDLHLIDVDVRVGLERDLQRHRAVVTGDRLHVDHALGAVHLRVDRRGDRLLDGDRVGAGVHGGRLDLRRRDLGELCGGQPEHHHGAADHEEDGDYDRDDRPVYEEPRHGDLYPCPGAAGAAGADVSGLGRTTIPSLTFWSPSVTTRSPGLSPSVMTQSPSTCSPAFTVRSATLSSGPTTATWYAPWVSCTACAGTRRAPRTVSVGARTLAYRP